MKLKFDIASQKKHAGSKIKSDVDSVVLRVGNSCYYAPASRGGALSGDRPSVCLSVCLMSRTSALTRKPKGLGRRNFAQGQGYPRSHATRTPTSRSKGQKSRSRGGGTLWRPTSRTACSLCTRWTDRQTNGQKQHILPPSLRPGP